MRTCFVSGSAGFIGFHLCQHLLDQGFAVVGYDGITDYYDTHLKIRRHQMLLQNQHFSAHVGMLEDFQRLRALILEEKPDVIIHLAAQAGVRYSIENPREYVDSNIVGTFNILECARELAVGHLLIASTSSIYGANEDLPYSENDKADTQLTLYAATKKSAESMAHSYSHLWELPTTIFRFFTVYGPWGRPDMALFKFTEGILQGAPIDVYNHGNMYRDFTYVTDLVKAVRLLIDLAPPLPSSSIARLTGDSISPVAPFRTINIGNSEKVRLIEFIEALEEACGTKAKKNFLDMQPGDVPATWADASLLEALTGYRPNTKVAEGIRKFVTWYREYYLC